MKTKLFGMACAAALTCVYSLSAHAAPTLVEVAKLLADDGAYGDDFGRSVAVSGDTAVIGARDDDDLGTDSGSAYVFVRSGSSWTQQAKLLADDGGSGDDFGWSVAVSGDTAVIGAYLHDAPGANSGAAYVFVRSGSSWTQQAELLADDGASSDYFGMSVAVSGNTAVIGATGAGRSSGAAYVFVRSGSSWTQQAKLLADDGAASDNFGDSVVLSGDTAVIGAYLHDAPGTNSGAAYVFVRSGTSWTQQAELLADDGAPWDYFGWSVAVSGDTAVIGTPFDNDLGYRSGAAYVFVRSGSSWTQQAKLLGDGGSSDQFGHSVAVSGDTVVISTPYDDDLGTDWGSAYVFMRNGTSWTQQTRLLNDDGAPWDLFGVSVAMSGDTAVIGAYGDDDNGFNTGAAYVFSVPGFDSVASLADLNSNGSPEIAVAMPGSTHVHIRDGSSDELITDIDFGADLAFDMAVLPDLDASGDPEIAILQQQASGQVRVQSRDSVTGNVTSNLWYGLQYEPVSMAIVPDYNSSGFPEIAVLGSQTGTDAVRVQVRDCDSGTFLDNVFLGTQSIARGLVSLTDTSGNGVPEMGILGVLKGNDQVRMQIWDADTSAFQSNVWFAKVYQPQSTITMPDINSNGSDEIVAVGVDPATQNIRVQVRDSDTTATLFNIWLGAVNEAVDIVLINDINSNGFADLAILLKTPGGTGRVRVQDGSTGAFIRNLFFGAVENPVGLAVMPDYSGNGFEELAALGENAGVSHVQILDTSSGAQVNRINFP